jgi:predicted RNase H-like HicB family nuclease
MVEKQIRTYVALTEVDKETGKYTAFLPDIDGVLTQGNDLEETIRNMQNALDLWVSDSSKKGIPLPEPKYSVNDAPSNTQTFEVNVKY